MYRILSQFARVFFYCNLFIAGCAASLVCAVIYLLNLSPIPYWFAALVFCCTLNIYTFHYYLKSLKTYNDERLNWYRKNKNLIQLLLLTVTLTIVILVIYHSSVLFSSENMLWTLAIPVLSLAYSFPFLPNGRALRHIGWLKLPLLSLVWSFTVTCLPVFYTGNFFNTGALILFTDVFIFITALCMLFNIRDYEEDKTDRVITPAVALGPQLILSKGKWVICGLNLVTSVLLISTFHFSNIIQIGAVILPVVLVFMLFKKFRFGRSEMQFVYLHDGLMPVKALLLIFAMLLNS